MLQRRLWQTLVYLISVLDTSAATSSPSLADIFIGLVGFEPTVSWSRTRRDTKLRYSPKGIVTFVGGRCASYFAYFSADSKEIDPCQSSGG